MVKVGALVTKLNAKVVPFDDPVGGGLTDVVVTLVVVVASAVASVVVAAFAAVVLTSTGGEADSSIETLSSVVAFEVVKGPSEVARSDWVVTSAEAGSPVVPLTNGAVDASLRVVTPTTLLAVVATDAASVTLPTGTGVVVVVFFSGAGAGGSVFSGAGKAGGPTVVVVFFSGAGAAGVRGAGATFSLVTGAGAIFSFVTGDGALGGCVVLALLASVVDGPHTTAAKQTASINFLASDAMLLSTIRESHINVASHTPLLGGSSRCRWATHPRQRLNGVDIP